MYYFPNALLKTFFTFGYVDLQGLFHRCTSSVSLMYIMLFSTSKKLQNIKDKNLKRSPEQQRDGLNLPS